MADMNTEGFEAENDTKNDREYNGKFHIIMGVNTPPGKRMAKCRDNRICQGDCNIQFT